MLVERFSVKQSLNISQLFIEILVTITVAEIGVMSILPIVAPGVEGLLEGLLDAVMLSIIAGPVIIWRMRHHFRRSKSDMVVEKTVSKPWRLIAGTATALILGLVITGSVVVGTKQQIMHAANLGFQRTSESLAVKIQDRVNRPRYGLKGAQGVYVVDSKIVERDEFAAFANSRDISKEFPGAIGVGVIERVMREDLDSFIAVQRADGDPDYSVKSLAQPGSALKDAPDLYLIKHCYPEDRNAAAWGLDTGSEPVRREAIERAVTSGQPAITGKITLVQDGNKLAGFLYLMPVYKNDSNPITPDERVAALSAVVYMPIILEEAVDNLQSLDHSDIDFEIYDSEIATEDTILYDFDKHREGLHGTTETSQLFQQNIPLQIGGRTWTFFTRSTPEFEAGIDHSIYISKGVAGTLLSLLLAGIMWTLGTSRARAVAMAKGMTTDLSAAVLETENLRSTLDKHSLVSVADAKGQILRANDHFCTISGYSLNELIGQDHRILNSGTHPKSFWANIWRTLASGQPWHGDVCNRSKDGSLYWVDTVIAPFMGSDGKPEKYVSIRNDITDRKHAEAKLSDALSQADAANESKSAFLANMSHEIRTPLTAILGFTELLREDGDTKLDSQKRIQAIDTISNAGEHLLSLINDILDLSKIEADKMTIECIDTPLIELVQGVESLMRPVAIGKGLSLSTTLLTPVPEHILSDPTRLRQILMNLIGNAIKFTEGGSVSIAVSATDSYGATKLVIDIEDTGLGMSKDQSAQLFQAFGQADETMTRKFGGSGLGLTICRRFAIIMGGDVNILRTEPGKGSCFRLIMPLEAVAGTAMVTSFDKVHESSANVAAVVTTKLSGRILLAEDGIDIQRLIGFHLKKGGAEVTIADNGKIALKMLDKADADGTPFDLLLTDMQMPEMDGYTLASTLRKRGSTLPIVALTAHAMAEDRAKCIDAGCDDYATKPINKMDLLATCAQWMGKAGGADHCKIAA